LAPLTGDQLKVGVVETPVNPLAGEFRVGAGSKVVKDTAAPLPHKPALFWAQAWK